MNRILLLLSICVVGYGCIRSEAPNAEADIDTCELVNEYIKSPPVITNSRVIFMAMPSIDRSALAPTFTLTEGARIAPLSGTALNFNTPQQYTVTSEDGKWQKNYTVSIDTSDLQTVYRFEHYEKPERSKYHVFFEMIPVQETGGFVRQDIWSSANAGYALTGMAHEPDEFPTASLQEGKNGRGVRLQTRSTGGFGAALTPPKPIAAGNFFIGSFDALKAMGKHLEATRFGLPFGKEPVKLKGYYRYKAGEVFTNANKEEIPGRVDRGNIAALVYETSDTLKYLDGTKIGKKSDAVHHPSIVLRAELPEAEWTNNDEWVEFEISFDPVPGRSIDYAKLKAYKYNLALIFTSSKGGDVFEGAVGSTLCIDEVEVICK